MSQQQKPQAPIVLPDAPASPESELALIGAMLIDADQFTSIDEMLTPEDFYLLRHQYIWQAMVTLHENGDAIDYITVAEVLENMGHLEDIGGRGYLIQLAGETGSAYHAQVYANLVKRTAIRRQLLHASDQITKLAFDEKRNIEEVIAEATKQFNTATSRMHDSDAPVHIYDLLSVYYDNLEERLSQSNPMVGIPTGYRDLDAKVAGWKKSDLVVVGARPGVGKTAWMLASAIAAAKAGYRVLFVSLEMGVEQLINRIIGIEGSINLMSLSNGRLTPHQAHLVTEIIGRMSSWNLWVQEKGSDYTPAKLRVDAERIAREQGLDLIFLDYVQLMEGKQNKQSKQDNRVAEVSYITRHLKLLAKDLKCPIVAAAQLNRDVENRKDKRPQLADLRESGSLEQDSDIVLFLYRDEMYNEATEFPNQAEVIIAKHRNGPTGTVSLYFDKVLAKYSDSSIERVNLADLDY